MNASRDPKAMAKTLRAEMSARDIAMSHSECLEITARQLGHADWNTLSAGINGGAMPVLQLPLGWAVAGSNASDYKIGIDPEKPGEPVTIQSLDLRGPHMGFVTLMQSCDAKDFLGKRLQLSADLSCAHVTGATTLWFRIDDGVGRNIRFDNMETRKKDGVLTGMHDWVRRTIVLDVPSSAETLNYGFYLRGEGQCWSRAFGLDVVGDDVPVTAESSSTHPHPMNLDFAEKSVMQ